MHTWLAATTQDDKTMEENNRSPGLTFGGPVETSLPLHTDFRAGSLRASASERAFVSKRENSHQSAKRQTEAELKAELRFGKETDLPPLSINTPTVSAPHCRMETIPVPQVFAPVNSSGRSIQVTRTRLFYSHKNTTAKMCRWLYCFQKLTRVTDCV